MKDFYLIILGGLIVIGCGGNGDRKTTKSNPVDKVSLDQSSTTANGNDGSGSNGSADSNSSGTGSEGSEDQVNNDPIADEIDKISDKSKVFRIVSDNFEHTKELPLSTVCQSKGGENKNPHLSWADVPDNTKYLMLVMDDEDSPCGIGTNACRHWQVYNIPPTVTEIKAGELNVRSLANGITLGVNYDFSNVYAGPCPPNLHNYRFTLFAMSGQMVPLAEGTTHTRASFRLQFSDKILAEAYIEGTFNGQ